MKRDSSTDARRPANRLMPGRRKHRYRRLLARYPRATPACAIVLVLLFATTAALSWQRAEAQEQAGHARAQGVDAATERAVSLLSYDHRSIDEDIDQARKLLTGPFQDEYTTLTREVIAPAAKEQRTTTRADVVRAAAVASEPDRVVVLLFLNQTTESAELEGPRIDGSRVRMTLKNVDESWLVSELKPV